ncbi:MAG: hypothetical protein H6739_32430 [Alphaproteobacteria bacterium]|nr:hypothetical protein [Alphaproteobacteria bacterium]
MKLRTHLGMFAAAGLFAVGCGDKDASESGEIPNESPTADAGPDQSLTADQQVCLDGAGSYDPDGDTLIFHWEFEHIPDGSTITDRESPFTDNHSETAVTPCFLPDAVGTYVISLFVSDGQESSPKDYVIVTTETPATIPVANAGTDQVVTSGDTVTLDGSGSYDPQGRPLSYVWSVVEIPDLSSLTDADLVGADTVSASFTADARGVFVLNLQVNNGLTDSLADAVVITSVGDDSSPVANAGEDISAEDCTAIQLDGSGSVDPDGDLLQYFWELQSAPSGSSADNSNFSSRTAENPTFYADISGTYHLSLTVSDGDGWSAPDRLVLEVAERSFNGPPSITITDWPLIDAGEAECTASGYTYNCDDCPDQTFEFGSNVTVNDPDGDVYTVLWELVNGDGTVASPESLITNLRLEDVETSEPGVCDVNEYDLRLTVTDCVGSTVSEITTVQIQCCGVEESDSGN